MTDAYMLQSNSSLTTKSCRISFSERGNYVTEVESTIGPILMIIL